jgi:hypothetical protein
MDQKAPDDGVNDGVYHCVTGKSFASECGSGWLHGCALAMVQPCPDTVFADVDAGGSVYSSRYRHCWEVFGACLQRQVGLSC